MKKRLLSVLALGVFLSYSATAQVFTIDEHVVEGNTTGTSPDLTDVDIAGTVNLHTFVTNVTNEDVVINWQHLSNLASHPAGWELLGICDNVVCRIPRQPWSTGTPQVSNPIPPNNNSAMGLMEARIAAPIATANGTGIFKVRIWTEDATNTITQQDTLTFILNKTATGVHQITLNDTRVAIFPNPSDKNINIYSDKGLNVTKIAIVNIVGREEFSTVASKTREITEISTSSLAKGMYMIHLTDATGKLVTSRKFVKN